MTRDAFIIVPMAIPVVILGVVIALRVSGSRKLTRMRQLACPDCRTAFAVPSLTAVRHWMDFDVDTGKTGRSGFTLRCQRCSADYRFTDSFEFVGREEQKRSV
jgi:hypothetical protein